jgi:Xaa-Pro dipeptidase
MVNRRSFLHISGLGITGAAMGSLAGAQAPAPVRALKPMTAGVEPITAGERMARIEKVRRLMSAQKIGAVYMERGSTMFYFTGARDLSGLLIPIAGDIAWIVPSAEAQRVHDASRVGGKIVAYAENDGPFSALKRALQDGGSLSAKIGLEEQVRFSVFDGLRQELPAAEFVNATPVTAGCRAIKSKAEIALMQHAADVTIEAYRAGLATLREGMTPRELSGNIDAAYKALGFRGEVSVSFGKNTAFPHGSTVAQTLKEGDMILLDDGCAVDGYQSDITRAVVFGKPSARQKQIWNLERQAQDAAFAAARLGATCESVDFAARKVIVDAGFGPGYKLPGLPHRTGHGIGLDIHEWTYMVKGNKTPLEAGMCFSDEPMIVEGEFGVRLEDCIYMTEEGARFFSKQSPAIDQPFG